MVGEVHHLSVLGRQFFIDDTGTVLRASWHLDRGFVNLSVWRGDRCTETFQLSVQDAARLIGYLADGLSTGASNAAASFDSSAATASSAVGRMRFALQRLAGSSGVFSKRRLGRH